MSKATQVALIRAVIVAAHDAFEDQDCTCAEGDGWNCWYRFDKGQQLERIVELVGMNYDVIRLLSDSASGRDPGDTQ